MNQGIRKDQSTALYGLAILFMLYHHLFCIPERINADYYGLWELLGIPFAERAVSWFAKICVAIYAFISGYGLFASYRRELDDSADLKEYLYTAYKYTFHRLLQFFRKYWLVFAIFIPIGVYLNKITLDFPNMLYSLIGRSNRYCGEWWYVSQYLSMVLALPAIHLGFDFLLLEHRRILPVFVSGMLLATVGALFAQFFPIQRPYTVIFLLGYICSRFSVFQIITNLLHRLPNYVPGIIGVMLIVCCFVVRTFSARNAADAIPDILIAPIFIYAFCILTPKESLILRGLKFFGKYSVYMWLTHTFFCYYYFQKIVTFSKFSTLIYITLIGISLVTAWILYHTERFLLKLLGKKG